MADEKLNRDDGTLGSHDAPNGVRINGEFATWAALTAMADEAAASFEPGASYLIDSAGGLSAIAMLMAALSVPRARTVWGQPAQLDGARPSSRPHVHHIPSIVHDQYRDMALYGTMTSGSTGAPKIPMGAVADLVAAANHHEDNIYAAIFGGSGQPGTLATCLRPDYVAPFLMCLLPAMLRHRSLLFTDAFDFDPVFDRLQREPVILLCVPALLSALTVFASARGPLAASGLTIICTGGHLSRARIDAAKCALPGVAIATTYGSSEYGTMTFNPVARGDFHVGPPVRGRQIWVAAPDAEGRGRLVTRGCECRLFYAYTNAPLVDGHGDALGTDYGRLDDAGNVHIDGRIDGALKVNGILVHAGLIEKHILALPGVIDARVKPTVNADTGSESLSAIVVGSVSAQEVLLHCKALPAGYLPRTCSVLPDAADSYSARGKL